MCGPGVELEGGGVLADPLLGSVCTGFALLGIGVGSGFARGSGLGSQGNVAICSKLRRFCQPYQQILLASGCMKLVGRGKQIMCHAKSLVCNVARARRQHCV